MNTVLITGCSSGFGRDTAKLFLDRGWTVVATMRSPQDGILPPSQRLRVLPLDVTDMESIGAAVAGAGPIDVLVNNAGIGWMNALEGTPMATVRDLFETNTFGTMAMTQAVLPQFRARQAGVIVNVTSSTTLKPLPLLSVYTASKAAINAFTESLALELEPFGIRARLVIPGQAPDTAFGGRARARIAAQGGFPAAYDSFIQSVLARRREQAPVELTHAMDVAEAVWMATTDASAPMRIPAGADAVALS